MTPDGKDLNISNTNTHYIDNNIGIIVLENYLNNYPKQYLPLNISHLDPNFVDSMLQGLDLKILIQASLQAFKVADLLKLAILRGDWIALIDTINHYAMDIDHREIIKEMVEEFSKLGISIEAYVYLLDCLIERIPNNTLSVLAELTQSLSLPDLQLIIMVILRNSYSSSGPTCLIYLSSIFKSLSTKSFFIENTNDPSLKYKSEISQTQLIFSRFDYLPNDFLVDIYNQLPSNVPGTNNVRDLLLKLRPDIAPLISQ